MDASHLIPIHNDNQFKYLINNKLEWTDLLGNSFLILKIDNLEPRADNIHIYNRKVL